jgi:hypothetical protein
MNTFDVLETEIVCLYQFLLSKMKTKWSERQCVRVCVCVCHVSSSMIYGLQSPIPPTDKSVLSAVVVSNIAILLVGL